MAADPNIFQQFLQPVRSVNDYLGDMDRREGNALQLVAQRRQNDLAGLQADQTRQTLADSSADRNALQRLAAGWGADTTSDQRVAALRASGRAGLMAQADALEKADVDKTKGRAAAAKDQSEADSKGFDLHQKKATQAITDIANLGSPQDALASLNAHRAAGDLDEMKYQSVMSTLQPTMQDPAQFGQWKRQMILGILDAKEQAAARAPKITMTNAGGTIVPTNTNADAGPVGAVPGAAPIQVTQSPDNVATVGATIRGQNLTDSRAREKNQIDRSAVGKVDWKQDADGNWVGLPKEVGSGPVTPVTTTGPGKREIQAGHSLDVIKEARGLLSNSTGSYLGAGADEAARLFGVSTQGAQTSAKLKALEGALMMTQPRMEGPQSDKDVLLYRQMAGQLGDPTVPAATKRAALDSIEALHKKYLKPGAVASSASPLDDIHAQADAILRGGR